MQKETVIMHGDPRQTVSNKVYPFKKIRNITLVRDSSEYVQVIIHAFMHINSPPTAVELRSTAI